MLPHTLMSVFFSVAKSFMYVVHVDSKTRAYGMTQKEAQ